MKANILKPAALAAMMALAACTTEVIESPGSNDLALGQGEDVIRISLSNTVGTRAARPIGSSEALNNVNRIAFKFLTNNGTEENGDIKLEGAINEDGETLSDYTVEGNVLKLPLSYAGTDIRVKFSGMTEGVYKIIAYGYNYTNGTDDSDAFPYSMDLASDKGYNTLYKVTGVTTAVQEIFAGCNEDTFVGVNQFGKFESVPNIKLTRQVAGLLAYFMNAPVFVNNTKVAKVTVSSKANVEGFYFPASMIYGTGFDTAYNGVKPDQGDWYLKTYVNLLTFDMSKASNYNDEHLDNGDCYKFSDSYLLADETGTIDGLVCAKNTLFGSRFLIPFPAYIDFGVSGYDCATLNICYWDASGNEILSVPLRNGGNETDNLHADSYQYGIKCNNFYSIGKKTETGDGGTDEPIDIREQTGYDYANVSISSDWEDSHNLVK